MIGTTVAFLVIAVAAGIFGFTPIAGGPAEIAKSIFPLALSVGVLGLIYGRRSPR